MNRSNILWTIVLLLITAVPALYLFIQSEYNTNKYTQEQFSEMRRQSLLLGYETGLVKGRSNVGENADIELESVTKRLDYLEINIKLPNWSNRSDGSTMKFIKKLTGKLAKKDRRFGEAFLLGWQGYIKLDSPGMFAEYNIIESARRAGYEVPESFREKDTYNYLLSRARSKITIAEEASDK